MGMSIENCIKELLINKEDDTYVLGNETINFAVDTMRKYQKIVEIVTNNELEWGNASVRANAFLEVKKVVEDGKDII